MSAASGNSASIVREYVFYVFFFKIQKTRFYVFLNDMSKIIENVIKSIKLLAKLTLCALKQIHIQLYVQHYIKLLIKIWP